MEKYRGLDSRGVAMCEEFPPPRRSATPCSKAAACLYRPLGSETNPSSSHHPPIQGLSETPYAPQSPRTPPPLPAATLKWGAYRLVDDARPGHVGSSYSLARRPPSTMGSETWERDAKLTTSTPPTPLTAALKWGTYRLVDDARPGRVGSSYGLARRPPSTTGSETWERDAK